MPTMKRETHWRWKGGKYVTRAGYVKVLTPEGHPYKGRYMCEHRLVMEKKLGRHLAKPERVHHVDGNRINNDPANLSLYSSQSEHARAETKKQIKYPILWDGSWLENRYTDEGLSQREISEIVGCSDGTVRYALRARKIKRRRYTVTARVIECKRKDWQPVSVEKTRRRVARKYVCDEGYVKVIKPKGHPCKGRYVFEHRLLMEGLLSRYLDPEERVHHIDGNRENNRPENLKLFVNQSRHAACGVKGKRVYEQIWSGAWLRKEYIGKKRSVTDIALEIGCSHGTIINALKQRGIGKRKYTMSAEALSARKKGAKAKKPRKIDRSACDPEWIKREYTKERRSFRHIGEELGWHKNKVKRYLEELGVPLRGHKEAARLFLAGRVKKK